MYLDVMAPRHEHQPAGVTGVIHEQNCAEIEPHNLMLALQRCTVWLSRVLWCYVWHIKPGKWHEWETCYCNS